MARQITAVVGIYRDGEGVERAVGILQGVGVRNTDVSLLSPEKESAKNFALQNGDISPEGRAAGAGTVVLGWLVGVGVLAIPGFGSFLVAGPIVTALAGVGRGGVSGLADALLGLGMSEYEAKGYEDQIRRGGILMSVHCDRLDWAKRAKRILQETGAEHIASDRDVESDRPMLRHVARRSKRLSLRWKLRSLTARWASRKSRGLVRADRFWKRAMAMRDAIRVSNSWRRSKSPSS
jgi:hypothetical protein